MAAILEVENLRAGYATGDVLQGVGVTVGPGEVVGVLGRNGVGKSTLMKCVIGILPARTGTIRFNGEDVTRMSPDKRARKGIGYVPQGREIFAKLSVIDNLRMGRFINEAAGAFELLLLDEPSDGVQPSIIQEIGAFLLELVRNKPIGVLLVEQNIDLMQTVATRAHVFEKGSVVATLGAEELRDIERVAQYLAV